MALRSIIKMSALVKRATNRPGGKNGHERVESGLRMDEDCWMPKDAEAGAAYAAIFPHLLSSSWFTMGG
jgi:hypothetical protein